MPRHPPCALNCLFYMACTALTVQGTYSMLSLLFLWVVSRYYTLTTYPRRMSFPSRDESNILVVDAYLHIHQLLTLLYLLLHHVKEPLVCPSMLSGALKHPIFLCISLREWDCSAQAHAPLKFLHQFLWSYRDSNPGPLPCKGSALAS